MESSCCSAFVALLAGLATLLAAVAEDVVAALVAASPVVATVLVAEAVLAVAVAVLAAVAVLLVVAAALAAEPISDSTCMSCERLFELSPDAARW